MVRRGRMRCRITKKGKTRWIKRLKAEATKPEEGAQEDRKRDRTRNGPLQPPSPCPQQIFSVVVICIAALCFGLVLGDMQAILI